MTGPADVATPVLIIGAGPVGMFLALDLAARGIRSTLIEKTSGSIDYPKGNTHNSRTMEHYRRLGLADEIRATGLPSDHPGDVAYFTSLAGYELARISMPSSDAKQAAVGSAITDQIPEPLHRANQMYVERVLLDHVRRTEAIEALFDTELTEFHDDGDHVHAVLTPVDGEPREITATYLVGCDGPRSVVRRELGIGYTGEDVRETGFMGGATHSTYLRIPELAKGLIANPAWQYWMIRPTSVSNLITLDGGEEFLYHAVKGDSTDEDVVRQQIRECVGTDVEIEVLDSKEWTAGRALVAEHYGLGRVFLCGDAVHLFTPTGGFGMNTGVDDAANLAWKLAATLDGWGSPELLATYEAERRPIAVRNTRAALDLAQSLKGIPLGPVLEADSVDGRAARTIAATVLAGFAQEFASLGIQLGARYDGSPLIRGDGTVPPPDRPDEYVPTACPGGRVPHLWLPDGRSLFDALGPGLTLLRVGEDAPDGLELVDEAAQQGIPLTTVTLTAPEAVALFGAELVLVRPDQYVAWRGDALLSPGPLLTAVLRGGSGD